eukprot:CAMPEP_0198674076 /NCGR_PEP_ID=MMETSP1467-20131203/97727_1 /TAXON_ID=1462469 /ORGANISM="unid. sp., Strain CCMP2135" /LENGTH=780 /DNA_ID=CAMNT_0044410965 /DNA_START=1529 /DNA_END=3868 /DNA_ORIENTATION=+
MDQARAVATMISALIDSRNPRVTAITAPRGRGKSAAIGLSLAAAIAAGYSSLLVTAPAAENVQMMFKFIIIGLVALDYVEHVDFEVSSSDTSPSMMTHSASCLLLRIDILTTRTCLDSNKIPDEPIPRKPFRRTIQYVFPDTLRRHELASRADLVVADEAAGIPLPHIRSFFDASILFLASTVAGYEGTGRALQFKLLQEIKHRLRNESLSTDTSEKKDRRTNAASVRQIFPRQVPQSTTTADHRIVELTLSTPIRYAEGDSIERWLHAVLCLDTQGTKVETSECGSPPHSLCTLFHVNRNSLFSYHHTSECFLQRIMSVYTRAHYRNSPNDLQLISDAPAHRLFVLLGPSSNLHSPQSTSPGQRDLDSHAEGDDCEWTGVDPMQPSLPDILVVAHVVLEGALTTRLDANHQYGAPGDLIPWTLSHHFCDSDMLKLTGVRVLRLATNPALHSMGYGSRALSLLMSFFRGNLLSNPSKKNCSQDVDESRPHSETTEQSKVCESGKASSQHKPTQESLPPLLTPACTVRPPMQLDWIGASFGATPGLYKFWARAQFRFVYIRQTTSQVTGEHTIIVLCSLRESHWLDTLVNDARCRFISLLASPCYRYVDLGLSLALIGGYEPKANLSTKILHAAQAMHACTSSRAWRGVSRTNIDTGQTGVDWDEDPKSACEDNRNFTNATMQELRVLFSPRDIMRLQHFTQHPFHHHIVADLASAAATLVFTKKLHVKMASLQAVVLLGIALQRRSIVEVSSELDLLQNQVHALYNKGLRNIFTQIIVTW